MLALGHVTVQSSPLPHAFNEMDCITHSGLSHMYSVCCNNYTVTLQGHQAACSSLLFFSDTCKRSQHASNITGMAADHMPTLCVLL